MISNWSKLIKEQAVLKKKSFWRRSILGIIGVFEGGNIARKIGQYDFLHRVFETIGQQTGFSPPLAITPDTPMIRIIKQALNIVFDVFLLFLLTFHQWHNVYCQSFV